MSKKFESMAGKMSTRQPLSVKLTLQKKSVETKVFIVKLFLGKDCKVETKLFKSLNHSWQPKQQLTHGC